MDRPKFSAPDHLHVDDQGEPHACNAGWITLGQMVVDDETGEEVEEYALYLCMRCGNREDG